MNGNREALGTMLRVACKRKLNIFRSDDRKYVCASQAMLRGTFHTFHEEEIAHLLPQNTAGTARVQRDR